MLDLCFGGNVRRVLALGAHADDIEIGCGATLMQMLQGSSRITVYWAVMSAHGDRVSEARDSAEALLANAAEHSIDIGAFRDGFFPHEGEAIKEHFERIKCAFQPDLIFTHYGRDAHQDHRVVSELTWNTFRNHVILEYEIPKYDGDLGTPNVFVPIEQSVAQRKPEHLLRHFATQRTKPWFTDDLFLSLMRLRGMECNATSRYAEAFYSRKLCIQTSDLFGASKDAPASALLASARS
jgi:LmbE family N-acetylglucosaminyl deacetylase